MTAADVQHGARILFGLILVGALIAGLFKG